VNELRTAFNLGIADHNIIAYGGYVELNRKLGKKGSLDMRLSLLGQSGNDISVFGFSDVYLVGTYLPTPKLSLTLGTKLPLMGASREKDMLPLPMDYQSSLGTVDLIFGLGYNVSRLQLFLAMQQPLTQNQNEFLAEEYPLHSPLASFPSTNEFVRAGDLLFRASYPFRLTQNLSLSPGLLFIQHLANDRFTNFMGQRETIFGSEGLTLNGNFFFDWKLNAHSSLQLNLGAPFISRDARPEGLTRGFVANVEYRFGF
jgi:hypothetical protein